MKLPTASKSILGPKLRMAAVGKLLRPLVAPHLLPVMYCCWVFLYWGGGLLPPYSPHTLIFTASIQHVTTVSCGAFKRVGKGPVLFLFADWFN